MVTSVNNVYEITGGSERGNLLFHSFEQFSLSTGEEALFKHGNDIDIILNRVTGGSNSYINGIISAPNLSTADIFLINPNGIEFGPGASLNIGGSFVASTADRIIFDNDVEFSASNPQPVSLTISQPLGLALDNNSAGIGNGLSVKGATLEVSPGEAITLVASEIDLLGGRLTARSGQIELASVAPGNLISLTSPNAVDGSSWILNYGNVGNQNFQDIQLSADSRLDVRSSSSSSPSGSIQVRGRHISLEESQVNAFNFGSLEGGLISIIAMGHLNLGNRSQIAALSFRSGDSGDLLIASERLSLSSGSQIATSAFSGSGNGGDLTVKVSGDVELSDASRILSRSEARATGAAGNLSLSAANLLVGDGSNISTSTFGSGDGGDLAVNASGDVKLIDASRILSQSEARATGAAGNLTLEAANLRIQSGSELSTSALGNGQAGQMIVNTRNGSIEITGIGERPNSSDISFSRLTSATRGEQNAGDIQINTQSLLIENGGLIQSISVFGVGNSGNIDINATESVTVAGTAGSQANNEPSSITSSNGVTSTGDAASIHISARRLVAQNGGRIFTSTNGTGQGGDLTVQSDEVILSGRGSPPSGLFARTEGSGDSGLLTLIADTLLIEDGARITVSTDEDAPLENLGTVQAANITARAITLDNAEITAESRSGDGGNLLFTVQDYILLRNGSLISATAGTAQTAGNGGNIEIDAPNGFVIAVPTEDSDIIANAYTGRGGNIFIEAQGIYGLIERPAIEGNGVSEIDASSRFGSSGSVALNNLAVDPAQGLLELPVAPVDDAPIAQRCLADSEGQNAFVVTGRGGIAPSPEAVVRNETDTLAGLGSSTVSSSAIAPSILHQAVSSNTTPEPLVEAQGWQRDASGNVVLLASADSSSRQPIQAEATCPPS